MSRIVLITRPVEDASRTASLIGERGYTPLIAPVLQVRPLHPVVPHDVQAVLITSGHALSGIQPWPVPVLAVGDVTAGKASALGFTNVRSASGDARALAALASAVLRPDAGPLLLLCGVNQGGALMDALRAQGFRILRRKTYESGQAEIFPAQALDALRAGTVHAAVFLSADTARAFVRLLPAGAAPLLGNVIALAIGKGASVALKPLPWQEVRLAAAPTLDHVLALL